MMSILRSVDRRSVRDVEQEIVIVQFYLMTVTLIRVLGLYLTREQLARICRQFTTIRQSAPANDEPEYDIDMVVMWEAERRAAERMPKAVASVLQMAKLPDDDPRPEGGEEEAIDMIGRAPEAKLQELQALIQEGIDSGDAVELDIERVIAAARRQKQKARPA